MVTEKTIVLLTSYRAAIVFLMLSLFSCGHIHIVSRGSIPVYAGDLDTHQTLVTIKGKKENYLWGLVAPDDHVVIDKIFKDRGFRSVADIQVTESQTMLDTIATIASLGFYIPRRYVVSGRGRR